MRTRLLGALVAMLLLVAACGDDNGVDDAAGGTLPDAPDVGEAPGVDIDDDLAASVNGTAIAAADVDARVESAIEADESLAEQFEGEQGEQMLGLFRAQTLTVLVQTQIILDGAAEVGVEPTEADIDEARAELVTELGGEAEFDEAVTAAGLTPEALDEQLHGIAALNRVAEQLIADGAAEDLPDQGQPEGAPELAEEDLVVQQWLGEQVALAEVVVHPTYGQWDPQSGQVMPPGGAGVPMMPGPEGGDMEELDEEDLEELLEEFEEDEQ